MKGWMLRRFGHAFKVVKMFVGTHLTQNRKIGIGTDRGRNVDSYISFNYVWPLIEVDGRYDELDPVDFYSNDHLYIFKCT